MVAAVLALWAAANVLSANPPEVPQIAHPVTDLVGVLGPQAEEEIARELVQHRDATGVQLAVLIVDTTHGRDIADYAQAVFDRWGGGSKERDDGALFVLAITDRRSRLHLGYGLEPVISDATAKRMLDELRPLLVARDYENATRQLVRSVKMRTEFLTPGEPIAPPRGAHPWAWVVVFLLATGLGIGWSRAFARGWRVYKRAKHTDQTLALLARQRPVLLALAVLVLGQIALALAFSTGRGYVMPYSLVYWHFIGVGWLIGGTPKIISIPLGVLTALAWLAAAGLADGPAYTEVSSLYSHIGGVIGLFWLVNVVVGLGIAGGASGGSGSYSSSYSSGSYPYSSSSSYSSSSYSSSSSSYSSSSYSGGGGSSGGGGASSSW